MSEMEALMFIVYISGTITSGGSIEENIARFFAAENKLKDDGFAVYNPAAVCVQGWTQYDYMAYYINTVLPMCSAMYMLKGWEHSKGACIEHEYALQHGMTIIYEGR